MNRPRLLSATCALILVSLAACTSTGGRENGPPGGGPGERGSGPRSVGAGGVQSVVDQVQTQLRDTAQELNLNPRQAVLWERYQDKVGALMADLIRLEPYRPANQTALQQIDGKVDVVRNRLAAMEDLSEAARQLYQSLDDGQKKVADRRLPQTVPTLYSGLMDRQGGSDRDVAPDQRSEGRSGRGAKGGGMGRY